MLGEKVKKIVLILFAIMMIVYCSACNQSNKNQNQDNNTQQKQTPGEIDNIEKTLEKIISTLEGPSEQQLEEKDTQKKQGSTSQKDDESNQKSSSNEQSSEASESTENSESSNQESKSAEEQKVSEDQPSTGSQEASNKSDDNSGSSGEEDTQWEELSSDINNLHKDWNSYMPKAVESGVDSNFIDGFSDKLNNLSVQVIAKKRVDTLIGANNAYSYLPDFYSKHGEGVSSEIKRVKYLVRCAVLNAYVDNWEQSDSNIKALDDLWRILHPLLGKNIEQTSSKVEYSISEYRKAVSERSKELVKIKANIILMNTTELEEVVEQSSSNKSS